jgi:hypothetical protein
MYVWNGDLIFDGGIHSSPGWYPTKYCYEWLLTHSLDGEFQAIARAKGRLLCSLQSPLCFSYGGTILVGQGFE